MRCSRALSLRLKWDGEWRSLVARFVRDEEVPGSNPGSPTTTALDQGPSYIPRQLSAGLVRGELVDQLCHAEVSVG